MSEEQRICATCFALVVMLAAVPAVTGSDGRDGASFSAGYAAVTDASWVRAEMTSPGTTSLTLCNSLVERTLVEADSTAVVRADFISGCTRAVADAME